jgi:hypothetical protein
MGDGPLRVVASQEIDGIGPCVSKPAVVEWRWQYGAATVPLWALVALLLVIPKANRNRQAWLILIPLALVMLLWRTPTMLFGMSEGSAQNLGCHIVSGAMSWTVVWLLGNWLGSRFRIANFFLILATVLAAGTMSFYCIFQGDADLPFFVYAIYYGLAVYCLVSAMMLAGRYCRKRLTPMRFSLWLLLWLAVVTEALAFLFFFAYVLTTQQFHGFTRGLTVVPTMAALLAGVVYLCNLPFLILVLNNPFYRRRLEAMFCVRPRMPRHGDGATPMATTSQPGEPCL